MIQRHITFALGLGLGLAGSAACQERRERRRPETHLHLINISTRRSDLPPRWRTGGVLVQLQARGMLLKHCSGVSGATELGEDTESCKKTLFTACKHVYAPRATRHRAERRCIMCRHLPSSYGGYDGLLCPSTHTRSDTIRRRRWRADGKILPTRTRRTSHAHPRLSNARPPHAARGVRRGPAPVAPRALIPCAVCLSLRLTVTAAAFGLAKFLGPDLNQLLFA